MIPANVSISCDSNPYYLEFWEPISRIWKKKFGLNPYLFFVGEKNNAPSDEWGTVVQIDPVPGIPIHTQAQWARFHFTQTLPDEIWITSDIDMFPLSRMYFLDMIKGVPDDCFVSLNSNMRDYFPVCYNVASGSLFRDVLDLSSSFSDDVGRVFESSRTDSHVVNGKIFENWGCDEKYSSEKICKYRSANPTKVVQLFRPGGFHGGRRIDRGVWQYDEELVKQEWYLDCHSIRPYSKHKQKIESLLTLVLGNLNV